MEVLSTDKIQLIRGGVSESETIAIDVAGVMIGISTGHQFSHHFFRYLQYETHNHFITILPNCAFQIIGAYLGYQIVQYFKSTEE